MDICPDKATVIRDGKEETVDAEDVEVGDLLVIMSFAQLTEEEAKNVKPRTITLAEKNTKIIKSQNMID